MQNNQLRKNNKGVTLVEVIAVIAVLGVVMAAVTGFMITGTRMSVQVSNNATVSSREQTAVEFINQRLWEANKVESDGESILLIGTVRLETIDGKIRYNGVDLCDGEINFSYDEATNTVTYYLNGTKHVVHLRTDPTTDNASEQE